MFKRHILKALLTFITIAGIGLLAYATQLPFLFPSLGPTAFLLFYKPMSETSSPRNTILGHLIGIVCGYLGLVVFGLIGSASAFDGGTSMQYIGSAAVALTLTSALTSWWKVEHPPAGATTLIISLGIMNTISDLTIMIAAIIVLCMASWVFNRMSGIPYPLWKWKPSVAATSSGELSNYP
jgi:CBS-domain-containing membrane protein